MSDTVRALAVVLSVLLWMPVAPSLVAGGTPAEEALLLYVAALLLSLTGCAGLAAILRAYAPADAPETPAEPEAEPGARRRESDRAA